MTDKPRYHDDDEYERDEHRGGTARHQFRRRLIALSEHMDQTIAWYNGLSRDDAYDDGPMYNAFNMLVDASHCVDYAAEEVADEE